MIRQISTALLLLVSLALVLPFATDAIAEEPASVQEKAEAALANGELETALDHYLTLVEQAPEDMEALEMAASLARELGLPELAAEMLMQEVEVAVAAGNKAMASRANEALSALYDRKPEWVDAAVGKAAQYSQARQEDVELWQDLSTEAEAALSRGDFETALTAQEGAVFLSEEVFGPDHWLTIAAMRDLGYIYRRMGKVNEAENYLTEALATAEEVLGEDHPRTLQISELLAELYAAAGQPEQGQIMREMVAAGYEATLGPAHPRTLGARYAEVDQLEAGGHYDEAITTTEALCADIEANYGQYHPQRFDCLRRQASLYAASGKLDQAEVTWQQLIDQMSEVLPSVNTQVLNALTQLAEVYRRQGRYQEAKDLLSGIIQTALQSGHVDLSYTAKSYLGRVLNNQGEFDKAQIVTEEVVDYGTANWQDRPMEVMNTLLELGAIYQHQGKLAAAEATYEEALYNLEQIAGETHSSTLVALNNLGQVYEKEGLYDQAEPILKEALEKFEARFGPAHPQTSNVRNNLALLHESQGNFREAEPLYIETLEYMEERLGPNHSDTIAVRNNLAFLYMLMQEYDKSAAMFAEVREQWAQVLGPTHQNTLKTTNNLARVYRRMGRLDEAEPLFVQALEQRRDLLGPEHLDSIRSMIDLGVLYVDQGRLDEARTLLADALALSESVLGEQHPYTFDALNALAKTREARGELEAALKLRETGLARRSEFLDRMLWVTGENAREGYIRLHRPEFYDYLSLLTRMDDPEAGKRAINASLQRKGLLLKITSEVHQITRLAADPELKAVTEKLKAARRELAAKTLSGPATETGKRHAEVLYELEQQVNELQGELGRASARYRRSIASISADTLETSLPEDSALVDFLVYEEAGQPKLLAGIAVNDGGEVRYELVDYSDRKEIQDIVIEYRTFIQDDLADEEEVFEIGQIAYEMIWDPIDAAIGDTEYVYLVPDGILNILPFNALVAGDDSYLIENRNLRMLTSARDLLPTPFDLARGDYVILAGPDYDSEGIISEEALQAARQRRSTDLQLHIRGVAAGLRGLSFQPLPGAREEGEIITNRVEQNQEPNETYFGEQAQEAVLNRFGQAPEILHMATHGFFLEPDDTLRKRLLKLQRGADLHVPPPGDNPLLRSGLAFAGVNNNARFLGEIDTDNDGVLTALEVLDLNLSGTRLVVLSACETGLGEIHEGEGVYGLKRSFQEAGVAEVVASLWEVSDAGTQALMTAFYERILQGMEPREALRETQLELMESPRWGYPYVWSSFMITGSYESAGYTLSLR